jgi:hypothetical protein
MIAIDFKAKSHYDRRPTSLSTHGSMEVVQGSGFRVQGSRFWFFGTLNIEPEP